MVRLLWHKIQAPEEVILFVWMLWFLVGGGDEGNGLEECRIGKYYRGSRSAPLPASSFDKKTSALQNIKNQEVCKYFYKQRQFLFFSIHRASSRSLGI